MYRLTAIVMLFFSSRVCADSVCEKMLDYTYQALPDWGVLTTRDGALYLDLDNQYIHDLVTFIRSEGFEAPEPVDLGSSLGAYIRVMAREEASGLDLSELVENGDVIYFTAKECRVAPCELSDEAYLVIVEAPELDRIRQKYGLPKRADEFYITIGVKPAAALSSNINF